jgi:ribosomal protein S27AE
MVKGRFLGPKDKHEHFDHDDDLEKCPKCKSDNLGFHPKFGLMCGECGFDEGKEQVAKLKEKELNETPYN